MFQRARRAIESMYQDSCTITVREPIRNIDTGITSFAERTLYTALPCRVSRKTLAAAGHNEVADKVSQVIVLYLAPETEIPAGSRIAVVRNGAEVLYCRSGEPMRYHTHQEIMLDLWKGWA